MHRSTSICLVLSLSVLSVAAAKKLLAPKDQRTPAKSSPVSAPPLPVRPQFSALPPTNRVYLPPVTNYFIRWPWTNNDRINNVFSVWETTEQRELVYWYRLQSAANPAGPWSTFCETNRPPVSISPTNATNYFRVQVYTVPFSTNAAYSPDWPARITITKP